MTSQKKKNFPHLRKNSSRQNKLTILKKESLKVNIHMQTTFNHTKIVQLPRLPNKINKQTKTDQGNKKSDWS